jgi:two-component system NtrC family sensor kinase
VSFAVLDRDYNRALFDLVPVPIVMARDESGVVTGANEAFLALVGLERDEVVGAAQPYPWRTDTVEPPCEPGVTIERLYRRPDGHTFPVEIATHELVGAEGERLVVAIVTDLSAKRRLEQQVVQSSKLAAIGELAAGVAHEINNPLLAILGLTEFLLLDAEEGTKQQERLLVIQQTGLEIKEIVRALLDFAHELPAEQHAVEFETIVRSTVGLFRRTNSNKDVELVERYEAHGADVDAYGDQLEQVVLNLLANARQAMPAGGTIQVTVRRDGRDVLLEVGDNGPGVPDELQDKIFDPFFTTRRARGGTGLGLSASLGIAQAHGGTLTVANCTSGSGAVFTLRIPVAE